MTSFKIADETLCIFVALMVTHLHIDQDVGDPADILTVIIMTSLNGNIFRVTGPVNSPQKGQ